MAGGLVSSMTGLTHKCLTRNPVRALGAVRVLRTIELLYLVLYTLFSRVRSCTSFSILEWRHSSSAWLYLHENPTRAAASNFSPILWLFRRTWHLRNFVIRRHLLDGRLPNIWPCGPSWRDSVRNVSGVQLWEFSIGGDKGHIRVQLWEFSIKNGLVTINSRNVTEKKENWFASDYKKMNWKIMFPVMFLEIF